MTGGSTSRADLPAGTDSAEIWRVLEAAADAAARHTLAMFRTELAVDNKSSHSFDPVTEADRAAERAIRAVIEAAFPDHGVAGEELPDKPAAGPFTWVIDPIDGTRGFISGLPLWGTLIGLTHEGRAIAGLMAQPHIGETFAAVGGESRATGRGPDRTLATSGVSRLADARLATTTPGLFRTAASRAAYDAVEAAARVARYGTDCYAYAMLADGHVDLVIEEGLKPVDIVALIPLIEAAGGVITGWSGGRTEAGGQILAAATPALHAEALEILSPAAA